MCRAECQLTEMVGTLCSGAHQFARTRATPPCCDSVCAMRRMACVGEKSVSQHGGMQHGTLERSERSELDSLHRAKASDGLACTRAGSVDRHVGHHWCAAAASVSCCTAKATHGSSRSVDPPTSPPLYEVASTTSGLHTTSGEMPTPSIRGWPGVV